MKKRFLSLLILIVLLLGASGAGAGGRPVPKYPVRPESGAAAVNAEGDPILYASTEEAGMNETFYLSWYEYDADWVVLYKSYNYGQFESLGFVDSAAAAYAVSESLLGHFDYVIMTLKDGEDWKQSNIVTVNIVADEDATCAFLEQRGLNNTWNILFMVYRTASIGGYNRSFTDAQIASVRRTASELKFTMEGLSDGKMKIGDVDLVVVDEPVTSASGPELYGGPATLTYGMDGDVDFTYIMSHKDVTLVAVFAPLLGLNDQYGWLGLGGTAIRVGSQDLYTVIINEIYDSGVHVECGGNEYPEDSLACVHEILHAVETNSSSVGWNGYEALHSGDENGYGNGTYDWYRVLMTNTLNNGHYGFLRQSYYVRHYPVERSMQSGLHTDYDGVQRYYISGLPHIIDLFLPASATSVEAEAFLDTGTGSVLIPESVVFIGDGAFDPGTVIYGKKGSYAETWAGRNGFRFIRIAE